MSAFLLFVIFHCISSSTGFDYRNVSSSWKCLSEGTALGNFPANVWYTNPRSARLLTSPADTWTTFPMEHAKYHVDDHGNLLTVPWLNPSDPIGFHIKPLGYGLENRIIFQLSLDSKSPVEPPYPSTTSIKRFSPNSQVTMMYLAYRNEAYQEFWNMMQEGLFNCHINRFMSYLYDVIEDSNETLTVNQRLKKKFVDWEKMQSLVDNCDVADCDEDTKRKLTELGRSIADMPYLQDKMPCYKGTMAPMCCYAGFSKRDRQEIAQSMRNFGMYDDELPRNERCWNMHDITSIRDFANSQCEVQDVNINSTTWTYSNKGDEMEIQKKLAFLNYSSTTNNELCNRYLFRSSDSCLEKWKLQPEEPQSSRHKFDSNSSFPCRASCYRGMIVQLELIARENKKADAHVTVIGFRHNRVSQPSYGEDVIYRGKRVPFFGFADNDKTIRNVRPDYLGVQVEVDEDFVLNNETYQAVWLKWTSGKLESRGNFVGPILQVGREGKAKPMIKVDFSRTDFKIGQNVDPFGFRYGWRGFELRRPKLDSVFTPQYVTLNSVRFGKGLRRKSEGTGCKKPPKINPCGENCEAMDLTFLYVTIGVLLGIVVIIAIASYFCGKRKVKRNKK